MSNDFNEDDILELIKIINESNFDELSLETGNLKLVLRKSKEANSHQEFEKVDKVQIITDSSQTSPSEEGVLLKEKNKDSVTATSITCSEENGLVAVKAPTVGIFYRSPSPGASPFVEEGTSVKENDTLCMIEIMKVFNSISAGVRGVVEKICVENGQTVEFGQILFLIQPSEDHEIISEDKKTYNADTDC